MTTSPTPALSHEQATAVRRWKTGHHVFHLQLAAINSVLDEVLSALSAGETDTLVLRLRQLRVLYDAATVSMKYAGSFSPHTYATLIRPSMDEPFVGAGFSGRFNREHATMLGALKQLRREVRLVLDRDGGPSELRDAGDALWSAQGRNRRNHMFVCQRFVPDGRSLLRQYFQRTGGNPVSRPPRPSAKER
jgi:hypothetical protein